MVATTLAALPLMASAEIDPEVKQYVNEKFYAAMPDRQELIDVDSTGYTALNDGSTLCAHLNAPTGRFRLGFALQGGGTY